MSCASRTDRRHAFSLVELMIVSVIAVVFTATAATVFIQLIQTSDAVDARIEAASNARFFLDTLTEDLMQASISPAIGRATLFVASHVPLTFGDLVDNDADGVVDEESPDGQDNDGDWILARDDRDLQTTFGATLIQERGFQVPDLGDGHLDEDVVFNLDELSFWVPGPSASNVTRRQLTYRVQNFAGEDKVAVRISRSEFNDGTPDLVETGPLAFEVVSLNFLHWDHTLAAPDWVETWDSGAIPAPELPAPGSVYAEITVHGASTRLLLPPTQPLVVTRMATIVNLENVIQSSGFVRSPASSVSTGPSTQVLVQGRDRRERPSSHAELGDIEGMAARSQTATFTTPVPRRGEQ